MTCRCVRFDGRPGRRSRLRVAAAVMIAVSWPVAAGGPAVAAGWNATVSRLPGAGFAAWGVNDSGVAVGLMQGPDGANHAGLWEAGALRDLNPDFARDVDGGSDMSWAWAVNSTGQIAAWTRTYADSPVAGWRAVVWADGRATVIQAPDGAAIGRAINDRGQVAGAYRKPDDDQHGRPFLWERGTLTTLGDQDGQATALNNRGDVVGWIEVTGPDGKATRQHAALWRQGTLTDLGVPDGFESSRAVGVNDRGQVLGVAVSGGESAPFVWENGQARRVTVACPADPTGRPDQATPEALNNAGQVVGTCQGARPVGFWWADGATTLLPPLDGDTTTTAHALNNDGVVVGSSASAQRGAAVIWTVKKRS